MNDEESQQFVNRIMTSDEFWARKNSAFTVASRNGRDKMSMLQHQHQGTDMSPKAPITVPKDATKEERTRAIAEAAARKKAAAKPVEQPVVGGKEERKAQATAAGVVKPSKPARPTKIPKDRNLVDNTDTVTEGDIRKRADKELDEKVKPKKDKSVKDESMLSVGDVAREVGIDPKRARAKLRAAGQEATEGRWPKVKRDSKEHAALVALLTPAPKAEEPDEEESDEEEEDEDEE